MLQYLPNIIFIGVLFLGIFFFARNLSRLYRNINFGKNGIRIARVMATHGEREYSEQEEDPENEIEYDEEVNE